MNTKRKRTDAILELLKREYLRGEAREPRIGSSWHGRVMAQIVEGRGTASASLMALIGRLSWRLVPATASLAVALAFLVAWTYPGIDYNPLQLLMSQVEELMLTRLLGV